MAAGIQSQGFQVQAMPSIQLANPAYFNSGAPLAAGLGAGVNLAGQVEQQALRRAQAEREAMLAPVQMAMYQAQLAEAQRKAAIPEFVPMGSDIVGGGVELRPADAGASFENFQVIEDITPVEKVTRGIEVLPGGVTREVVRRDTMKGKEQVRAEAEKARIAARSAEALAEQRLRGKQFESTALVQLIEDAEAVGDMETAEMYRARLGRINAAPGILQPGVTAGRRLETIGTNAGFTVDEISTLGQTAEGINAMIKIGKRNELIGKGEMFVPKELNLTPEETAVVTRVRTKATPQGTTTTVTGVEDIVSGLGGAATAQTVNPKNLTGRDLDAYNWAIQNPNDARSAKILQQLGGR